MRENFNLLLPVECVSYKDLREMRSTFSHAYGWTTSVDMIVMCVHKDTKKNVMDERKWT